MDISTVVNIVLCILSFILALISIVTVVITLRQNHTMIENATRPYICVYGESINTGTSTFYLVIKNFGCSPATITKFSYEPDLSKCYGIPNVSRNFLADISKCTLAPVDLTTTTLLTMYPLILSTFLERKNIRNISQLT